jgi:cytochrome b6-f complex iron-sulfur subunit
MPRETLWLAPQDRIKVLASIGALAGTLILVVALVVVFGAFAQPSRDVGEPSARLYVGDAGKYQVGQPVVFPEGRFWLVKQADGSFIALSWKSTHLGCTVPWRETLSFTDPRDGATKQGWFRDPCHGATWDVNGVLVAGTAPRDLDRYPVEVEGSSVYVLATARLLIRGEPRTYAAP